MGVESLTNVQRSTPTLTLPLLGGGNNCSLKHERRV